MTPATITGGRARVAYLAPWGTAAAGRLLAGALRADLRVLSSVKTIEQGGRTYPSGTLIFPVDQNPSEMHDTTYDVPKWRSLGNAPTSSSSAGATRFVLEGQYGYPVTPIRSRRITSTDLRAFDVLILPEGDYGSVFDEGATESLKRWVREGGTLIGLGRAVDYLTEAEPNVAASEIDTAFDPAGIGSDDLGACLAREFVERFKTASTKR